MRGNGEISDADPTTGSKRGGSIGVGPCPSAPIPIIAAILFPIIQVPRRRRAPRIGIEMVQHLSSIILETGLPINLDGWSVYSIEFNICVPGDADCATFLERIGSSS